MPKTQKFLKMERSMVKEYGKKKGESIAYATANKRGWKV